MRLLVILFLLFIIASTSSAVSPSIQEDLLKQLHRAVLNVDIAKVKVALSHNALKNVALAPLLFSREPNDSSCFETSSINGGTLLHEIFACNVTSAVEAFSNVTNDNGKFRATMEDRFDVLQLLINETDLATSIDDVGRDGNPTILALTCGLNSAWPLIEYLIENGADIYGKNQPNSPLKKAVTSGIYQNLKILLKYDKSKNMDTQNGILWAINSTNESLEIVDLLLHHGSATITVTDIDEALKRRKYATALFLIDRGGKIGKSNLIRSLETNDLVVFEKFLSLATWDINEPLTTSNDTILHLALSSSAYHIIEMLLQRGADPNLRDSSGYTALFSPDLFHPDHYRTAKLLLVNGANPNLHIEGITPLLMCAAMNRVRLAQLLIDHGALIEYRFNETVVMSALKVAVSNGHLEMARLLLDNKADINITLGEQLETCLHVAVRKLNSKMVELLLDRGADVNARRGDGKTPLATLFDQKTLAPNALATQPEIYRIAPLLTKFGGHI